MRDINGARYDETGKGFNILGLCLRILQQLLSGRGHVFLDSFKISSNSFVVTTTPRCSKSSFVFIIALESLSALSHGSEIFNGSVL